MNNPSLLIDSVIVIDLFNKNPRARAWIAAVPRQDISISVVTMSEVLVGISDDEKPDVMSFLGYYPCFPIVESTAQIAAQLRRQYRWKLIDAYQAALAKEHGLTLVTRNTKDFNPKAHSFVKIPYSL